MGPTPDALVWVSGFGGCKIRAQDGCMKPRWPARLEAEGAGGAAVQKAKPAASSRVLVRSFGDDAYIWAKPETLCPLKTEEVRAALETASARVRPALEAAIACRPAANKAKRKATVQPPSPMQPPSPASPHTPVQPPPPSGVPGSPDDGLSAYERKRLEQIKQNEAALAALGVTSAAEDLRRARAADKKKPIDPAVVAARARERQLRLEEAQANKRQSSRLQGTPVADRTPKRYADEFNPDEEEEEAALYRESKKRMKTASRAGLSGGRGSRGGKGGVAASLTEAERAAVAEAFEAAESWLEAMSAFFVDKLSEANLRNVMKQATLLATGEGVPHKRYPNRYFRKGEPVTLDEDMTELRAAANRFLLPEDDPGHGWCLDHPIGKMGIFQAYLHAKGGA